MKLVVALDVDLRKAKSLINVLASCVDYYKIGHKLFIQQPGILKYLSGKKKNIFLDMKYHDIPSVVGLAIKEVSKKYRPFAITMHTSGGKGMLGEALKARNELPKNRRPLLFGVTVLTSLDSNDMENLYGTSDLNKKVRSLALFAKECGIDGIVCSGKEVADIKGLCGKSFLTLVPGVSIGNEVVRKDQKRVVSIEQIAKYIDYAVVGRQITEAINPLSEVRKIMELSE